MANTVQLSLTRKLLKVPHLDHFIDVPRAIRDLKEQLLAEAKKLERFPVDATIECSHVDVRFQFTLGEKNPYTISMFIDYDFPVPDRLEAALLETWKQQFHELRELDEGGGVVFLVGEKDDATFTVDKERVRDLQSDVLVEDYRTNQPLDETVVNEEEEVIRR